MDYWMIASGTIPFILLVLTLIVVFRVVHAYDAVVWYSRLCIIYSLGCFAVWGAGISSGLIGNVGTSVEFAICVTTSLLIYTLLSLLFLFGAFGIFEASITLHILKIIAQAGAIGIHQNAIVSGYNRITIVKKRIDRMMRSRDIVVVGKYYRLQKTFSYLVLREYALNFLRFLYPNL